MSTIGLFVPLNLFKFEIHHQIDHLMSVTCGFNKSKVTHSAVWIMGKLQFISWKNQNQLRKPQAMSLLCLSTSVSQNCEVQECTHIHGYSICYVWSFFLTMQMFGAWNSICRPNVKPQGLQQYNFNRASSHLHPECLGDLQPSRNVELWSSWWLWCGPSSNRTPSQFSWFWNPRPCS